MSKLLKVDTTSGEIHLNPAAISFVEDYPDDRQCSVVVLTGHQFRVLGQSAQEVADAIEALDAPPAPTP